MSATTSSARRDAASASIQQLRLRLLDLTARNPLISFDHGSRAASRAHVRVVNVGLNDIYKRLIEPKPVLLRALPPMQAEPHDEATSVFLSALDLARQTDNDYAQAIDALSPEEATSAKAGLFERKLRDKVRAELGMPSASRTVSQDLGEHAQRHGINPAFDLPLAASAKPQAVDAQTTLLPDQFERRLSKIRDAARVIAEETGVSALYTAFGFLEWFEADSSERALTSPLLLLRTNVEKAISKSHVQYSLEEAGDDVQVNLTLSERLKRDFNVILPTIWEDEPPGAYLARVEADVCADRPRWRIRRWITLALFPFARLAMYEDLDEDRWATAGGLPDHPVVGELLGGSDPVGEMFAREHDVDSPEIAAAVPVMVLEADSSQFSAVYDVMTGKNLVIEGPPGTGKSQTITNMIAAALASGKRVLFVADKQTALQVVKDRLDKVGLGDFCLEIHSGKARKRDVLDSIEKRLQRRPQAETFGLESRRRELASMKAGLTRYATILNTPFGAERRTIQELLWADRSRRQVETETARRVDALKLDGVESLADVDLDRLKSLLIRFERSAQVALAGASPDVHPWFGIQRSDLPAMDIELAQRAVADLHRRLDDLQAQSAAFLGRIGLEADISLTNLAETCRLVAEISIPTGYPQTWYATLQDAVNRDLAARWLADAQTFRSLAREGEALGFDLSNLPDPEAIDGLLSMLPDAQAGLPPSLSTAAIGPHVERLLDEARIAEGIVNAAARSVAAFGLNCDVAAADLLTMIRLVDIVAQANDRTLSFAVPSLLERDADEAIEAASKTLGELRAARAGLVAEFNLDKLPSPQDLRIHATALRGSGVFGFLSAATKEALKVHASVWKGTGKIAKATAAAQLGKLADHVEALERLRNDADLNRIFGRRFKGLETDDSLAAACAAMGDALRGALVGYDEVVVKLRRIVLAADEDRFRAIAALRNRTLSTEACAQLARIDPATTLTVDLPTNLRGRAKAASAYASTAIRIGLPMDAPLGRHAEILRLILTLTATAARVRRPASLVTALGPEAPEARGDLTSLEEALEAVRIISTVSIPDASRVALKSMRPHTIMREIVTTARSLDVSASAAIALWNDVRALLLIVPSAFLGGDFHDLPISLLAARFASANAHRDKLGAWIAHLFERNEAAANGLSDLLALWDDRLGQGSLVETLDRVFYRSLTREAFAKFPELNRFSGIGQEEVRDKFRALDQQVAALGRWSVVGTLLKRAIPAGSGVGRRSEYTDLALIHNELAKKMKLLPIRSLMDRAGGAVQAMKPCFMMSPLSVAQYLRPGGLRFDLLVIDEASQMRPEDALGAVARCSQMVVVGDPKQLAPTSFFDRGDVVSDDECDDAVDAESVLDQSLARFRPARRLRWHYRSKHDSLIAFSNKEFYDNDLIVFPSPAAVGDDQGVSLCKVDGLYRARSNVPEAMAVCEAAVDHMRRHPDRSLGIATLNIVQKQLISDEMDRLAATDADVETYVQRWSDGLERFFVKNLETVQGDERDTIFVSTVFGPAEVGGPVRQNFGPINGRDGHRRLNVLFTRAKHQLRVFTSMTADQVASNEDAPRGARVLRDYLSYAATGRLEAGEETGREPDSDFELFVAERLAAAGYECAMQVGVAGFFLDIAVRDPARRGTFLLGVECDGATYHSTKSARDRDILRQQVLEGLGWNIYRIWSTDWFRDPQGQTAKLLAHLAELRAASLSGRPSIKARAPEQSPSTTDSVIISRSEEADFGKREPSSCSRCCTRLRLPSGRSGFVSCPVCHHRDFYVT